MVVFLIIAFTNIKKKFIPYSLKPFIYVFESTNVSLLTNTACFRMFDTEYYHTCKYLLLLMFHLTGTSVISTCSLV